MNFRFIAGEAKNKDAFFEAYQKVMRISGFKRVSGTPKLKEYVQLSNSILINLEMGTQQIVLDGIGQFEYSEDEVALAFALQELVSHYLNADILEEVKGSVRGILVAYEALLLLGSACHNPEVLDRAVEYFGMAEGGMQHLLKKLVSEN